MYKLKSDPIPKSFISSTNKLVSSCFNTYNQNPRVNLKPREGGAFKGLLFQCFIIFGGCCYLGSPNAA